MAADQGRITNNLPLGTTFSTILLKCFTLECFRWTCPEHLCPDFIETISTFDQNDPIYVLMTWVRKLMPNQILHVFYFAKVRAWHFSSTLCCCNCVFGFSVDAWKSGAISQPKYKIFWCIWDVCITWSRDIITWQQHQLFYLPSMYDILKFHRISSNLGQVIVNSRKNHILRLWAMP